MVIFATQCHVFYHFWTFLKDTSLSWCTLLAQLILSELSLMLLYLALLTLCHAAGLLITLVFVFLHLCFVKLGQVGEIVAQKKIGNCFCAPFQLPINYRRFLRENARVLGVIFGANRLFAKPLYIFILVNVPINAGQLAMLLLLQQSGSRASFLEQFFILFTWFQQLVCIVGMHVVAAQLNGAVHWPSKQVSNNFEYFLISFNNLINFLGF